MKKLNLILILLFASGIIFPSIIVDNPEPYYIGTAIGFNKDCHDPARQTSQWDFGDGTVIVYPNDNNRGWQYHTYAEPGTYTVKYTHGGLFATTSFPTPLCGFSASPYVEIFRVTVGIDRSISYHPVTPRADQLVSFQATNFIGPNINWNFGDGTALTGGISYQHRFISSGTYTVTAAETTITHGPVTAQVTVLPDDRFITVSPPEALINEPVIFRANNFFSEGILWNFDNGIELIAGNTVSHTFTGPGNYTVRARDESGQSSKVFEINIRILGISDEVTLEVAEISFDNGKYYKVVPRNSKKIKALLKMRMRGTGAVIGHWLVDNTPYGFINDLAVQGEIKEIFTPDSHPLPTIDPGLHTVSFRLTRPEMNVDFPILRYYVLPYEISMKTFSPPDGFVAKENEIPEFKWDFARGSVKYQIAFSNSILNLLRSGSGIVWHDAGTNLTFIPEKEVWDNLKRNQWSYWKVRALDNLNNVLAETDVNQVKIVIATAEISINSVSDMKGNEIKLDKDGLRSSEQILLVKGEVEYDGDSDYLILRVLIDDTIIDQLLFRDVHKGEKRKFQTSLQNYKGGKVVFQILKTSSPSVIVGIKGFIIKN